jgi:hypothetical protein
VAQGVGPEFKPQYQKTKQSKATPQHNATPSQHTENKNHKPRSQKVSTQKAQDCCMWSFLTLIIVSVINEVRIAYDKMLNCKCG